MQDYNNVATCTILLTGYNALLCVSENIREEKMLQPIKHFVTKYSWDKRALRYDYDLLTFHLIDLIDSS